VTGEELAERPGRPAEPELSANRERMAAAALAGTWDTAPPAEPCTIAGIRAIRFAVAAPRALVVHFHGGGYRLGCPEAAGPFARTLADRCQVEVICPEYRLAPEHPFPAALIDGRAVVSALAADCKVPLILSGDSAGGGLAAGLILTLTLGPEPPCIAGLALHSPWLDLSVSAASYRENAPSDPLFSADAARRSADSYLQGHPIEDPRASAALGRLESFPPSLVTVGAGEVLRDDARSFARRLNEAGVAVRLVEIAGMEHTAVVRGPRLPGADRALAATADFITALAAR
jgi:acetyl esterase/lipase